MEIRTNRIITPSHGTQSTNGRAEKGKTESTDFRTLFKEKLEQNKQVTFTKHAENRMIQRHIVLDRKQMERLNLGVDMASKKGVKDSLLLVDDIAFIVNVKDKKVITAVDSSNLKNNVFTNIDGAVIV